MPQIQQPPPNTGPSLSSQVAPWMTSNGTGGAPAAINTSFYNDSSDNLSVASQLSPGFRIPGGRPSISQPSGVGADNNEASYFGDERRPSIASITTTASSQGSKASGNRGGFRKLQGFFGEEFPGRDSSDTSLPPAVPGKEHRSHSYSHGRPYRDRNYSNATDHTRDGSPSSSRPRTPVPAPEVVPFLYQEADVCCRLLFLFLSFYFISQSSLSRPSPLTAYTHRVIPASMFFRPILLELVFFPHVMRVFAFHPSSKLSNMEEKGSISDSCRTLQNMAKLLSGISCLAPIVNVM